MPDLKPLGGNDIIFPGIQNAPFRRVENNLPVEVWDPDLLPYDRICERNPRRPYHVYTLAHKFGMVLNFDVKFKVARLLRRTLSLFAEAMTRDDVTSLGPWDDFQF